MSFFRVSGILETISTISLFFIAMPLKYIGGNEILVKIIGPIHGVIHSIHCTGLVGTTSRKDEYQFSNQGNACGNSSRWPYLV